MRIVHLADLHLGYRQGARSAPNGLNARECDVAKTFEGLIDDVIAIAPDLVVIAGDVFHTVRPSNVAVLHAFKQLKRMHRALPDLTTVIAAGNHDLPRSADVGCVLPILTEIPGVLVAYAGSRVFATADDCYAHVLAVPDVIGMRAPELRIDSDGVPRIMVLHGEVAGALPIGLSRNEYEIPVAALHLDELDYCALGHYHVSTEIAPNCYYAGSMDYTSSDPWGELKEEAKRGLSGKSFLEYDTESRTVTRHMVRNTRPLVDLPPIAADGLSAAEVDAAIASAVAGVPGGIEGKIARLVVRDIPVTVSRDLNVKAIRDYRWRAFALNLDYLRPERMAHSVSIGAPGRRPNLGELLGAKLAQVAAEANIDPQEFAALGRRYLDKAEEAAVPVEAQG